VVVDDKLQNLEKHGAPLIVKAHVLSALGKRLTRKSSAQNIERRDAVRTDGSHVSQRFYTIVALIGAARSDIYITGHSAHPPQFAEGVVETSNTTKKIYKGQLMAFTHFLL